MKRRLEGRRLFGSMAEKGYDAGFKVVSWRQREIVVVGLTVKFLQELDLPYRVLVWRAHSL